MKVIFVLPLLATCALANCSSIDIAPDVDRRPVPLDAIINQMKCELALALTKIDPKKLNLKGWYIDGKLTAKVITGSDSSANLTTPELIPLGAGLSGGFKIGGGLVISRTLDQVSDFIVSPYASTAAICDVPRAPGVRSVAGLGVYKWLHNLTSSASGEPRIALTNLSYALDFGVKRTGNAGLDVAVIGLKASASTTVSRDDINQLVLNFKPGDKLVAVAKDRMRLTPNPGSIRSSDGTTIQPYSLRLPGLLGGPPNLNDEQMYDMQQKRTLPETN